MGISNFFLCDCCRKKIKDFGTDVLCQHTWPCAPKKVMYDHHGVGGKRYDEPTDVCKEYEPKEEIMSKKQRNLDGIYFRVKRDGKWQNVCYSDMEQRERDEVARKRAETSTPAEQAQWWRSMADALADAIYDMGEQLGVKCE